VVRLSVTRLAFFIVFLGIGCTLSDQWSAGERHGSSCSKQVKKITTDDDQFVPHRHYRSPLVSSLDFGSAFVLDS
jgi:hypothetical protein